MTSPKKQKISTIIFDFDGTLADTIGSIIKIVVRLTKERGGEDLLKKFSLDQLREMTPGEIIKLTKLPLYQLPILLLRGRRLMTGKITKVRFFPGIKELLIKLKKQGYQLGILSSNSLDNLDRFLVVNQSRWLFDFIHSEPNIFGKDRALNHLLKKYKLKKDATVYLGDEVRDIEACRKIGMKVIAVSWGFNTADLLKKYRPDFLVDQPQEIGKILS